MEFDSGGIYHIYNQGNNRQKIFFKLDNYIFFLRKIRHYIMLYGHFLAWCLMPYHFHFMFEVEFTEIKIENTSDNPGNEKIRTLNDRIAIVLRSYTRGVNIQQNSCGSLFRGKTKSISLNEIKGISSNWYITFGNTFMNAYVPEYQYPQTCFNYIHANPVKAKLVKLPEDWEFSSYMDLKGLKNGNLIDRERVAELGLILQ